MKHNLSPNNTVIGSDHPATPIVSLGGTDCAVTRSLFSYAYGDALRDGSYAIVTRHG